MKAFAKETDMTRQIQGLQKQMEKQQSKISDKLVERSEFSRLETSLKKWTSDGFADKDKVE